jgi:hypothetical protein
MAMQVRQELHTEHIMGLRGCRSFMHLKLKVSHRIREMRTLERAAHFAAAQQHGTCTSSLSL